MSNYILIKMLKIKYQVIIFFSWKSFIVNIIEISCWHFYVNLEPIVFLWMNTLYFPLILTGYHSILKWEQNGLATVLKNWNKWSQENSVFKVKWFYLAAKRSSILSEMKDGEIYHVHWSEDMMLPMMLVLPNNIRWLAQREGTYQVVSELLLFLSL